ncbi:MAG: DegT/DnrJ/EryC1/StrS family aminotransferase [Flavobacteriales bacterium]|nr:DegT/DnrJ/EryC1/StrS family aminotransferase [Flavobacteriales bacterium]
MIPFLDLKNLNLRLSDEFKKAADLVLSNGQYILGNQVSSFENAFAEFCNSDHCIGVGSGLDALTILLEGYKTLGKLQTGDGIIVPANTFIATILAISKAGLVPVLVEPNQDTFNLCPTKVKEAISANTKAIMAVHLYGQMAPMNELKALAEQHHLLLFEDAAQAHGALIDGKKAGAWSDAAAFSFYPGKNLGALGDAGAITTSDAELNSIVRNYRNYGSEVKYVHTQKGVNSRLDELQAAFLSIKLKSLEADNGLRRAMAERYKKDIVNPLIHTPNHPANALSHVWHLYVIRCEQRDRLKLYLHQKGIETLIHYPIPPHKQAAFAELNHLQFPITEKIHNEVLSLPIYPGLSDSNQLKIIAALNAFE